MSEMLGNQYFMARKYNNAITEFEEIIAENKANKPIRKKLIICYTQIGKILKSLEHFHQLISEDIEFIINTNVIEDDCPCPELITQAENSLFNNTESSDYYILLGILWLYCDKQKSIENFRKALKTNTDNELIKSCYAIISEYISQNGLPQINIPQ